MFKRLLLIAALVLLSPGISRAQNPPPEKVAPRSCDPIDITPP